jgi:hypothetical protein
MDANIVVAIVSASSAVVVGIAALVVNAVWMGRAFELVNKRIDRLDTGMDKINTTLEMLTGSLHDLDKRLSLMEDRILNRPS